MQYYNRMKTIKLVFIGVMVLTACGKEPSALPNGNKLCASDTEIVEAATCPAGFTETTPEELAKDEFGEQDSSEFGELEFF